MVQKVLLFDVMGTLVRDPFYDCVPSFFGLSLTELLDVKNPTAWLDFELGKIDEPTLFARYFSDGRSFDGLGLRAAMQRAYAWNDGVPELLAQLAQAQVPMHAFSNYPQWFELIEAKLGVSRYVAWTFVSCNTGLRKPDPQAYEVAIRTLDVVAAQCVFVDDRSDNCQAAAALGMTALRFESAAKLGADLRQIGLV